MKPGVPIHAVRAAAFEIPTDQPEGDGTLSWSSTVLVVARVEAGPAHGLGWTYAARSAVTVIEEKLAPVLQGAEALDIPAANQAMRHETRNLGQPGVAACAISALDVALWDLKARVLEVPLAEPVSSDDRAGLRLVRDQCPMDVAAGEYGYSPWYYTPLLAAGCLDCVQADATRCGGITGWLAVAQLAAAHHLDISAHCAPYLHAPVALATPNLRHVEYFHDHVRIERRYFDGAASPEAGALPADAGTPGHGLAFKDADAERFRIA